MILRLEDNGSLQGKFQHRGHGRHRGKNITDMVSIKKHDGMNKIKRQPMKGRRVFFNPENGNAVIIEPKQELSGLFKGLKKRIKAKKAFKEKKREVRQENKLARVTARQESKTKRQATGQLRKQTKKEVGVAKQEGRVAKVRGRARVKAAQQQARISKAEAKQRDAEQQQMYSPEEGQEATYSPEYETDSDSLPDEIYDRTQGGEYVANQGGGETMDVDYEEVEPDEENDSNQFQDNGVPLAGWVQDLFNIGSGAVKGIAKKSKGKTKAGRILQKLAPSNPEQQTTAGKLIQSFTTEQSDSLQQENEFLKSELAKQKKKTVYYTISGIVVSGITSALVTKNISKR